MQRHGRFLRVLATILVLVFLSSAISSSLAEGDVDFMDALGIIRFDKKIKAPDFSLKRLNGSEVRLEDLRGKLVFLNFWATWCPPCRAEMPSMEKLYTEFGDRDFVMLAVNLRENAERVATFKRRLELSFPILLDSDGTIGLTYGVRSIPTTYLIDQNGYLIGGALGARDWSGEEAFGLVRHLLEGPPGP